MTNEEILEELKRRELEILTQGEFEFDEKILPKIKKQAGEILDEKFFSNFSKTVRMAFLNGVSYGFLKYIENRIEQKG